MPRRGLWIAALCCSVLAAGCTWQLGVGSKSVVATTTAARLAVPTLNVRTRTAVKIIAACAAQELVLARINETSGAEELAPRVRKAARNCRLDARLLSDDWVRGFNRGGVAGRRAALLFARAYDDSAAALEAADLARARRARRTLRAADAAERVAVRLINRSRRRAGLAPLDPLKELFGSLPAR
jgi:hypothetical protein